MSETMQWLLGFFLLAAVLALYALAGEAPMGAGEAPMGGL